MSSEIIYKRQALRFDPTLTGLSEPLFVLACIGGCNRTTSQRFNSRTGRSQEVLARKWYPLAAGSYRQVMRFAIGVGMETYASHVYIGRNRGHSTGSAFVGSTRKLLDGALAALETAGAEGFRDGLTVRFGMRKADYSFAQFDGSVRDVFTRADVLEALANGDLRQFINVKGPDPYVATGLQPGF